MYEYCSAGIMKTVSICRIEPAIHQRHLELHLEIGHGTQSPDDDLRLPARGIVDEQPVKRVDLDVRAGP